jgi:hypothetical protein
MSQHNTNSIHMGRPCQEKIAHTMVLIWGYRTRQGLARVLEMEVGALQVARWGRVLADKGGEAPSGPIQT